MMAFFLFSKTHAQYSCQTATQLIVKDSLELDTFSHSGYDDRWLMFTYNDTSSYIGFHWDWESFNSFTPYDSIIIYTGSCNQLNLHQIISPVPSCLDLYFNDLTDVFFQFKRSDNIPFYFDFQFSVEKVGFGKQVCGFDKQQTGTLLQLVNLSLCGLNYVAETVKLCERWDIYQTSVSQPALININGIPNNPEIISAYLWWKVEAVNDQSLSVCTLSTPTNTHVINGTEIGVSPLYGNNWGGRTYSYRADVTNFITPPYNGQYFISGLPIGIVPFDYADTYGATLIIIYKDPNSQKAGNLIIYDGLLSNESGEHETFFQTLSGFSVNSYIGPGKAFVQMADNQHHYGPNPHVVFNGGAPVFFFADMWNFVTGNTSVSIGQNTFDIEVHSPDDAVSLQFVGLYFQSNTFNASASNEGPYCEGKEIQLLSSPAYATYEWSGPNGFTSPDQNPIIPVADLIHAGTYTVTITDNNCASTASTVVEVFPAPDPAVIIGPYITCSPTTEWEINNYNEEEYSYEWYIVADGLETLLQTNGQYFSYDWQSNYPNGGKIKVVVTDQNGCTEVV